MNKNNILMMCDGHNLITTLARAAVFRIANAGRGFVGSAIALILILSTQISRADSATWSSAPSSGNWHSAQNWLPTTVPNDPADTAIFSSSSQTTVSLSASTQVAAIDFLSGADAYKITTDFPLVITGAGIANGSGLLQNFVVNGAIGFTNSATAGSATKFTADGGTVTGALGGFTQFLNNSTAGNGTFITNGGTVPGASSGFTEFFDNSTAGNGAFISNGGTFISNGGQINFCDNSTAGAGVFTTTGAAFTWFTNKSSAGTGTFTIGGSANSTSTGGIVDLSSNSTAANGNFTIDGGTASDAPGGTMHIFSNASNGTFTTNGGTVDGASGGTIHIFSSAGNATFTNNGGAVSGAGGGRINFSDGTTAGNALLIANGGAGGGEGGSIWLLGNSTGGSARIQVFGNGNLEIGARDLPGVTIGSLSGNGDVFLGDRTLTVGSNNLSTTFSGVIQGGGLIGARGGSLTKIGTGTLTLAASNAYLGETLITAGTLEASHDLALSSGNVSLTASGAKLKLQSGATNNYIADIATLSIVSGSIVDLNFTGNADRIGTLLVDGIPQPAGVYGSAASGAPNQLPQFTGTGTIWIPAFVVSRKIQGAGTFDIPLPLTECRSGGPDKNYKVVFNFADAVTFTGVAVIAGKGTVTSTAGNGGVQAIVNLKGVTNAQTTTIRLSGVKVVQNGKKLNQVLAQLPVLIGDTTGNRSVNSSDVSQTKSQSGQLITAANFRTDVTGDGSINSSDVSLVKSKSGSGVKAPFSQEREVSNTVTGSANFPSGQKVNHLATANAAAQTDVWISSETGRTDPGDGTFANPYDGSTQVKFDALMNSIPDSTHLHLGVGKFYTQRIVPKENWTIEGEGKYLTTISFPAGRCTKVPFQQTIYRVIGADSVRNYFSVRNLTIDCNRVNQPAFKTNAAGVSIYALKSVCNNADIVNVRALGIWTNGRRPDGTKKEGFPMSIEHPGNLSTTDRIVFDGCEVINPQGYLSAIITFDQLGGTFTGAIRRCYVQNHLNGNSFSPGKGEIDFEIADNYAYNCWTGSTIDTGNHKNLRYYGNHFIKMHTGVNMFKGKGSYTNIAIHHNYFDIVPDGLSAFGHYGFGTVKNIQIYNNTIIERNAQRPAMLFNPETTGFVRDNIISENAGTDLGATSLAVWGNVTPDNVALSLGKP